MRNYVVKNCDAEGSPIIDNGQAPYYYDDKMLVPDGYIFNMSQATKNLLTIYVNCETELGYI
ncbi:MAG: hypothetical protein U9Q21_03270 [Candidatus Auribacterota bacterium]|nr:hypothetical protein [Candidatus Auribacterota bacterium]